MSQNVIETDLHENGTILTKSYLIIGLILHQTK